MPTAPINGTDLYYETRGEGFPLVYVHGGFGGLGTGAGAAVPSWVERFSAHFRVILYDRRSSGRSGFPESDHSLEQFAGDIRGLLAHLGCDRAHVWGTSAGGQITLAFGLEHPDAAASLVVAESAPWLSRDEELLAKLRERIGILKTRGVDAAYAARREGGTVGLNLFGASRPTPRQGDQSARNAQRDLIRAQLAQIPREERIAKYAGELRTYAAYADWDASPRFAELDMPLLLVYGTADSVFPNAGWDALAKDRPNVRYRPVEGAEHGAAQSEEILSEILDFLMRTRPPVG